MLGEILGALSRGETDDKSDEGDLVPNKVPDKVPNNIRSEYPQVHEIAWQIASLLHTTPSASANQIGETIGLSDRMVRKHIATLRKLGIIERVGSNKSGYWKVNWNR